MALNLRAYAVPLDGNPHRLTVGTRPVPSGEWLLPGDDGPGQLTRKQELLAARPQEVLGMLAGSEAACREVFTLVRRELGQDTAGPQDVGPEEALRGAAGLVQEDLCVLQRRTDGWVLTAACVCFPSRWRLEAKLGAALGEIHAPVPGYQERLDAATNGVFERLAGDPSAILGRFNWTLNADAELFQPVSGPPATVAAEEVGERVVLRVERQTLRALPDSGAVLFTIRTFVTPLAELDERECAALLGSMADVSPELLRYRSWVGYFGAVKQWLSHRSGG